MLFAVLWSQGMPDDYKVILQWKAASKKYRQFYIFFHWSSNDWDLTEWQQVPNHSLFSTLSLWDVLQSPFGKWSLKSIFSLTRDAISTAFILVCLDGCDKMLQTRGREYKWQKLISHNSTGRLGACSGPTPWAHGRGLKPHSGTCFP